MRRMAMVGVGVLLFGAGAAAGYGGAVVLVDDDSGEGTISESELDRLIDACVASPEGEGAACAAFVDNLVTDLEAEGCGYSEAIELLDLEMRYPGTGAPMRDQWWDEATRYCD